MNRLAPLRNGPEAVMQTLLVQADAAMTAAKEIEEHLDLAYTGFQVNFVMWALVALVTTSVERLSTQRLTSLQAIVDFVGVDINVKTIPTCDDPIAGMQLTVQHVLQGLQSLKLLQRQPEAQPRVVRNMPEDASLSHCGLRHPETLQVGNTCRPAVGDTGAASARERSVNGSVRLAQQDACRDLRENHRDEKAVQGSVPNPSPLLEEQPVSRRKSPRKPAQSTTPYQHQHNVEEPHSSPCTNQQVSQVSPTRAASKQRSPLPESHASPPTLTCNYTDLLATPPSQRQQRQVFQPTEIFEPFFQSELPAASGPASQACAEAHNNGSASAAALQSAVHTQQPQTAEFDYASVGPAVADIPVQVGAARSHAEQAADAHPGDTQLRSAAGPSATGSALPQTGVVAEAATFQDVMHSTERASEDAAAVPALRAGPPAVQAMLDVPLCSGTKKSNAKEPVQPVPSTGLAASKLVAAAPGGAPAAEPAQPGAEQAEQPDKAPPAPRAVGASFGWRPLGAAPSASTRPSSVVRAPSIATARATGVPVPAAAEVPARMQTVPDPCAAAAPAAHVIAWLSRSGAWLQHRRRL